MSLDDAWRAVRDFHVSFDHPLADTPTLLTPERVAKRNKWMAEEIRELAESTTVTEQADAMIDLIYFALGTLVEMGVRPQERFDIVHRANMSKLGEDGRPLFGADGKVVKPEGWVDPEPELERAIRAQAEN